jgi:hypothetical protein
MAMAVTVLMAVPALAAEGYKFHIRVTDMQAVFQAEGELKNTASLRVEKPSHDRVMFLDETRGLHWRWLVLNIVTPSAEQGLAVEQGIDSRGGANPKGTADLSFLALDETSVRVRCLHDLCTLRVTGPDEKPVDLALHRDEAKDILFDSDVEVTFN